VREVPVQQVVLDDPDRAVLFVLQTAEECE
jgi:hypothetical protein